MKKVQILLLLVLLWAALPGQTYPPANIDTLSCDTLRRPNFFYHEWFDTCEWFQKPDQVPWVDQSDCEFKDYDIYFPPDSILDRHDMRKIVTFQMYTPNTIRIRGIWAMVSQLQYNPSWPGSYDYVISPTKLPEYVYLYLPDTSRDWASRIPDENDTSSYYAYHLIRIATARWDTLMPRMMCIPTTADARFGYQYCLLYEIPLDTVITLDGEFWIGGSCYNNEYYRHAYSHFPSLYLAVGKSFRSPPPYRYWTYGFEPDGPWDWCFYQSGTSWTHSGYGPFGVIMVDQRLVEVISADTSRGRALGSGYYCDSTLQTITAVPNQGYLFSHWNDGDTTNPRQVFVTADTSFTAYFRDEWYTVRAIANDNRRGHVEGGGTYRTAETVDLTAMPYDSTLYFFSHWDDGDTANPRQIVVVSDTTLTAIFLSPSDTATGIAPVTTPAPLFTLTPNPTTGEVTVSLGQPPLTLTHSSVSKADSSPNLGEQLVLTLRDAAGHEVFRKEFSIVNSQFSTTIDLSSLPAGAYFVTLSTPTASSTQRLVVK